MSVLSASLMFLSQTETYASMNYRMMSQTRYAGEAAVQKANFRKTFESGTPHPELGSRDILAETIAAMKPRGIRVVPYISTGHKLAWSMVTRDYPEYAHRARPGGGPAPARPGSRSATSAWRGRARAPAPTTSSRCQPVSRSR